MVSGDVSQNALKRSDLDGTMIRNDLVVFPSGLGGNPKVRAALTGHDIPERPQRFRQVCAA